MSETVKDEGDQGVIEKAEKTVEATAESIKQTVETAVSDPSVVEKAETVVKDAVAKVEAAGGPEAVVDQVESQANGVISEAEHLARQAEAAIAGFVHRADVTVGEVIAALVNRVHALEEKLGIVKPPIVK